MQKATAEPQTPEVPFLVRQHLSKHGIQPETGPTGVKHMHAEVTLLRDTFGMVQVFFRSDTLLDLEKIHRQTGRKLEPLATPDIDRIKAKLSVNTLPAFDDLVDAETYIDQRLFSAEDFFVHSGNSDRLIRVRSGAELKHKDSTRIFDLCVDLPEPLPDIDDLGVFEHDRNEIYRAVTSFTALRIRQRLSETLEIPPLSETAQAIIRLRADPDADITKLSRIVEKDPSLAAQVVSWASSSYYAAPGSIKSVQDAIVRVLGYDLVMNLALGLALGKTLEMPDDQPEGFSSYWTRAVFVAATCGALLAKIPREFRPGFGLVYLTGLLHNFGYLILAHAFRPHFSATCRMMETNRHLPHQHIEQHLLGITGDQIAASLLHYWKMPNEVCLGIRYQIEPHYQGAHSDHAQLVYLANHLLQKHGLLPGLAHEFDPAVYDYLHLSPDDVEDAMNEIFEAKDQLAVIVQGLES
ncbi:HDOD domain-containing protein [Saccharospirillum mangrovi]|uniref:HDOD domain-containing protein n=1 Tax=Saccharospirillum mangrovi TaxID=2161747 RepID=UPI000D3CEB76|nr:HDOD domain-containing protein [Saccharospirillum mangrovi]